MKEKEIKLLANEAHVLQERLLDIEDYIWNNIKSEVKAKSSFGEYASLVRIVFYPNFINVKVYDSGYDLYETEIIKFTHEQLSELMP
jgi:hypothetical protein